MIRSCIVALSIFLVIGFAAPGIGQDARFQTTKEEMIQELTKKPMRTRSFIPESKKRRIIVLKKKENQTTDSDGSDAYNLKLSLNRALSVKDYLVGNFSIKRDRLKVVGYGEAVPLAPNTSALNKQMNRRVEVQIF